MPVHHRREGSLAVVTPEGRYETADLRAAVDDVLAIFDERGAAALVFDLGASESLQDRSAQDVRNMAYFLATRGARFGYRFAAVAPSDLAFGLMRLGTVVTQDQGVESRVFRDFATARAWLARDATNH